MTAHSYHDEPDRPPVRGRVDRTAHADPTVTIAEYARILDLAQATGNARIMKRATLRHQAKAADHAQLSGAVDVCESAVVAGHARAAGWATLYGHARLEGHAVVCDAASVCGHTTVDGKALIGGLATVTNQGMRPLRIGGRTVLGGRARIVSADSYQTLELPDATVTFWVTRHRDHIEMGAWGVEMPREPVGNVEIGKITVEQAVELWETGRVMDEYRTSGVYDRT